MHQSISISDWFWGPKAKESGEGGGYSYTITYSKRTLGVGLRKCVPQQRDYLKVWSCDSENHLFCWLPWSDMWFTTWVVHQWAPPGNGRGFQPKTDATPCFTLYVFPWRDAGTVWCLPLSWISGLSLDSPYIYPVVFLSRHFDLSVLSFLCWGLGLGFFWLLMVLLQKIPKYFLLRL